MGGRGIWLNNPPGIVPSTKIPEKAAEGALIILRAYGGFHHGSYGLWRKQCVSRKEKRMGKEAKWGLS